MFIVPVDECGVSLYKKNTQHVQVHFGILNVKFISNMAV